MKRSMHLIKNKAFVNLFIGLFMGLNLSFSSNVVAQVTNTTETDVKPLKIYDIEIVLFKNINVPKGAEKILPTQAPLLDKQFISFANQRDIASAAKLGFVIPNENEKRLLDIVKKIELSSRYQLLSHLVWRQPGFDKEKALSIQIRTGKQFGNDFSSIDPPVQPLLKNNKKNYSAKVWYELEGKITISLARYLHANIDIVLRVPSDNEIEINNAFKAIESLKFEQEISFTSSTLNNYSFKEHRRMRSRKLHYLDHPEMGMLILITPYEAPQEIKFIEDI